MPVERKIETVLNPSKSKCECRLFSVSFQHCPFCPFKTTESKWRTQSHFSSQPVLVSQLQIGGAHVPWSSKFHRAFASIFFFDSFFVQCLVRRVSPHSVCLVGAFCFHLWRLPRLRTKSQSTGPPRTSELVMTPLVLWQLQVFQ